MSRSLKSVLYDAATSLLESRDQVEARDVVRKARMLHGNVFEREQERLVMEAAGRIAKAIMKELSENDQPPLPPLTRLRRSQPTTSVRWISPPLRAGRAGGGPANSGKTPSR